MKTLFFLKVTLKKRMILKIKNDGENDKKTISGLLRERKRNDIIKKNKSNYPKAF